MSKKLKTLIILILIISLLTLTGCWDRVELENRAFIMVTGLDKYDPEKSTSGKANQPEENENNRFKMTYSIPKFSSIKEGLSGKESRIVLSSVGRTPYEITRQITLRGDSKPFFQHMKATVLGVDIVKNREYFLEILDGLERQDEISRKLYMFIAEDQAYDILNVESNIKPLWYKLQGMSGDNVSTTAYIPKTLEEVISATVQGATLIPRITASKEEIKVAGSAVIKDAEFKGWLGEKETKAVAFLRGDAKQDIQQIVHDGVTIPYIIKNIKVEKTAKVEDGKINLEIIVMTRGNIQQYKVMKYPRLIEVDFLKELEGKIEAEIEKDLNFIVGKLQNEMVVDVLEVGEYLETHEPDIWEQVKEDWDRVFPKTNIKVKVISSIDKVGAIQ